jgi:hypothetical protein
MPPLEPFWEGSLVGVGWTQQAVRHEVLYDPKGIRRPDLSGVPAGCRLAAVQRTKDQTTVWIPPSRGDGAEPGK